MEELDVDAIVDAYLVDLDRALRKLPAHQRIQMLIDVRQHIDEARAEELFVDEAAIRRILEDVGSPETLATEAAPDLPRWRQRPALVGGGSVAVLALFAAGFAARAVTEPTPTALTRLPHNVTVVPPTKSIAVPDVVGESVQEASRSLHSAGLHVIAEISANGSSGSKVAFEVPPAGARVAAGAAVTLALGGPDAIPRGSAPYGPGAASTTTTMPIQDTQSTGNGALHLTAAPPSTTTTTAPVG